MKQVFFNETRQLRPGVRRNFMLMEQKYDDQDGPVIIESEWEKRSHEQRAGHTNLGFGRSYAHEVAMADMDERLQPLHNIRKVL